MAEKVVAIDARLVGGSHTGDSTYWAGLLAGLGALRSDLSFLLVSNKKAPEGLDPWIKDHWLVAGGRSSRYWSMVIFPLVARTRRALAHTQYNASPLLGRHFFTTIHDVSFFVGPEWFKPRDRFLLQKGVPGSASRAARVITVSETSKADIERYIPAAKGKVVVTPLAPGIGTQRVPVDKAKAFVHRELGINGSFALTIGTRWPRKNLRLATDAFELLANESSMQLVVAGKSGWGSEAKSSEKVRYTGYVSDAVLSNLLSAAHLYLMPSYYEGFGIPVLEAFLCGCPVLASKGGAIPEVAGSAARIVDSWEAADWADAIREIWDDSGKLEQLRQAGLKRLDSFSWLETARLTEAAYQEALA